MTSDVLFARGTRTLRRCSFDARNRGQSEATPWGESNERAWKEERGVAGCPSCSQNAHDRNVLVRCAQ